MSEERLLNFITEINEKLNYLIDAIEPQTGQSFDEFKRKIVPIDVDETDALLATIKMSDENGVDDCGRINTDASN